MARAGTARCLLLMLAALAALPAATVSLALDGRSAADAVSLATRLTGAEHELPPGDPAAAGERVTLAVVDASPSALRQALAHALGRWWVRTPGGAIRYPREAVLPLGALVTRTRTSGLVGRPALEDLATSLLAPWSGPGTGLSYEPREGLWTATFDADGQARLLELLILLERPGTQVVPPLLPDPDAPAADARLAVAIRAAGWPELVRACAAAGISTSVADGLPPPAAPLALAPGPLAGLPAQLAAAGVPAAMLRGVLCIGGSVPIEREHPAQRRRLALLPVPHLAPGDAEGALLVQAVRRRVAPHWWGLPGAGVAWMPDQRALLVAADAGIIHAVLDLLDEADRRGLAAVAGTDRR